MLLSEYFSSGFLPFSGAFLSGPVGSDIFCPRPHPIGSCINQMVGCSSVHSWVVSGWRAVNRFPCSHHTLSSLSVMASWAFFLAYQWVLNHAGVSKTIQRGIFNLLALLWDQPRPSIINRHRITSLSTSSLSIGSSPWCCRPSKNIVFLWSCGRCVPGSLDNKTHSSPSSLQNMGVHVTYTNSPGTLNMYFKMQLPPMQTPWK